MCLKLHLGCGNITLNGFVNIDIRNLEGVDVVCDISQLPYEDNTVDLIYSCANIEHFSRNTYFNTLKHWYNKLKPGGILRLSTADFEAVCNEYIENKNIEKLLGLVVGGQKNDYDNHGMIFDFDLIKKDLTKIGFKDVHRYDWRKTEHNQVDDYSQAYLPHMDKENGRLMMLNIEAIK